MSEGDESGAELLAGSASGDAAGAVEESAKAASEVAGMVGEIRDGDAGAAAAAGVGAVGSVAAALAEDAKKAKELMEVVETGASVAERIELLPGGEHGAAASQEVGRLTGPNEAFGGGRTGRGPRSGLIGSDEVFGQSSSSRHYGRESDLVSADDVFGSAGVSFHLEVRGIDIA